MHGTYGLNNPWHHLRKMSSWVGNPGRPPYVIPRGSAGLKKKVNKLRLLHFCIVIESQSFTHGHQANANLFSVFSRTEMLLSLSSSLLRPRKGGLSLASCALVGLLLCQLLVTLTEAEPEPRRGRSRSRGKGKVAPAEPELDALDAAEAGASREEKRKWTDHKQQQHVFCQSSQGGLFKTF